MSNSNHCFLLAGILIPIIYLRNFFVFTTNRWMIFSIFILTTIFVFYRYILKKKKWKHWCVYTVFLSYLLVLFSLLLYSKSLNGEKSPIEKVPVIHTHSGGLGGSMYKVLFRGRPISRHIPYHTQIYIEKKLEEYSANISYVELSSDVYYIQKVELIHMDSIVKLK